MNRPWINLIAAPLWFFITILGFTFAIITVKRKNIIWVFTAHLTLNFIEFIYISL